MTNILNNYLIYHALNLDYPNEILNYEDQTNKTINNIMNDFINKYKKDFNNKYFILISQNDIYSLIAYNILKNIQGLYDFKLKVYKNNGLTKKDINKKDFISYFKLKTINQKNIIYISCFNPILKVKNNNNMFRKLSGENSYNIIEKFTPKQFEIIIKFYNLYKSKLFKSYQVRDIDFEHFISDLSLPHYYINKYFNNLIEQSKNKEIYLIKFEGDEKDFKIFDEIITTNNICLYFFENKVEDFLKRNLNVFINSSNIINKYNSNNYSLAYECLRQNFKYQLIGNWTTQENKIWEEFKTE